MKRKNRLLYFVFAIFTFYGCFAPRHEQSEFVGITAIGGTILMSHDTYISKDFLSTGDTLVKTRTEVYVITKFSDTIEAESYFYPYRRKK